MVVWSVNANASAILFFIFSMPPNQAINEASGSQGSPLRLPPL
jgi:hypothetical protein